MAVDVAGADDDYTDYAGADDGAGAADDGDGANDADGDDDAGGGGGADADAVRSASLAGLEDVVLDGQAACKGLATSASIFRHTLGELDKALDSLRLREAWAGAQPANGVS